VDPCIPENSRHSVPNIARPLSQGLSSLALNINVFLTFLPTRSYPQVAPVYLLPSRLVSSACLFDGRTTLNLTCTPLYNLASSVESTIHSPQTRRATLPNSLHSFISPIISTINHDERR
jgi:hypothetical protein